MEARKKQVDEMGEERRMIHFLDYYCSFGECKYLFHILYVLYCIVNVNVHKELKENMNEDNLNYLTV